jgi:hypothetical protein
VRKGGLARHEHGGHHIDVRDVAQRTEHRHHAGIGDIRADGVQRLRAQAEDLAVLVEGHFGADELVAPVVVAQHRFGARRHPLHRPAEHARGPQDEAVLGIDVAFHAEAAADVRRHHAQLDLRHLEHPAAEDGAHAVRILRARMESECVVGGVVIPQGRARLHGIRGYAVVVEAHRDLVLRPGECRFGRLLVAHHQRKGEIAGRVVIPDLGCALLRRILDADHGGKRLVVDLDALGGDARLLGRGGDDEGDAVAHVAHLRGLEQRTERAIALRAAHVFGHEQRRDAADACLPEILAGDDAQHARQLQRLARVDSADARVRVRRHHNRAVHHVGKLHVVDVARATGKEALVFDPENGLSDSETSHGVCLS